MNLTAQPGGDSPKKGQIGMIGEQIHLAFLRKTERETRV